MYSLVISFFPCISFCFCFNLKLVWQHKLSQWSWFWFWYIRAVDKDCMCSPLFLVLEPRTSPTLTRICTPLWGKFARFDKKLCSCVFQGLKKKSTEELEGDQTERVCKWDGGAGEVEGPAAPHLSNGSLWCAPKLIIYLLDMFKCIHGELA